MPYDFTDDPDDLTRADFDHQRDPLLSLMRGVLVDDKHEEDQGSFGITVVVNGAVISGSLVGPAPWSAALVKSMSESPTSTGTTLAPAIAHALEQWSTSRRETVVRRDAEDRPTPDTQVMSLMDAYLLQGGNTSVRLGLVRVLVSEVDAWSFTQITPAG